MAYSNVTGTSGSNTLFFQGITGFYNQTLVNPYSGYTVTISGTKNVNNAIYDGLGGNDTLSMTTLGDVLTLVDSAGTIMVKNVEAFNAGFDGDVIVLAHATVGYGNVTLRGSDGDDLLWSNNGNDIMLGGAGNDIMDGGGGNDQMYGGDDNDYMAGGLGMDALFGGAGNDILGYVADSVWSGGYTLASLGSSALYANLINLDGKNRSHDIFNGDATDALVEPTVGTDTLLMTDGDDVLVLSDVLSPMSALYSPRVAYIDIFEAGKGDDVIDLSGGVHVATTIHGGEGNDVLAGSVNNDTITGDHGNDWLSGGGGNDSLSGGEGDDRYYYKLGDGNDTITETSGHDCIHFGPGITMSNIVLSVSGNDVLISVGGNTITVQNHFAADLSGRVENIVFDDGSEFDLASYGLNEAPVANDDSFGGDEDSVITGNVLDNDTDADGDTLTVTAASFVTALGGSVILNADGSFTYQGAANFHGNDSFTYEITDTSGETSTATVNLSVGSVNDAPVVTDDSFSGDEDTVITGSVLGNDTDVDGDTLTVLAGTFATTQGGSVTINADGTFSYLGATNFNGADSFDYKVLDGLGGWDIGRVDLTIGEVNDAPVANDDTYAGNEDSPVTGNVLDNDGDADGDTISAIPETITTLQGGSVTLNADGTFIYTALANYHGSDSFSYTMRDALGATSTANVLLSIASVNDAPVAVDDSFTGLRNGTIAGELVSNDTDIDGDVLSVQAGSFATLNGGTVVLASDGSFTYTPAANFYGEDSFDYTVLDGLGGTDLGTVAFTVNLDPSQSIIGTENADTLTGTNGNDEIFGMGGDDILYGDDGILTGSALDKVFADTIVMPNLKEGVNITNLRPKGDPALGINDGNLTVDHDAVATVTFRKGYAGYDNSFGVFGIAADGTIVNASLEWKNVKTAGLDVAHDIDLPVGADGGAFGFFIISNGNNANSGYGSLDVTGDGVLSFVYNYGQAGQRAAKVTDPGNKVSVVYNDGTTIKVLKGDVYVTTDRGDSTAINEDGKTHVVSGLMDTNNKYLDIKNGDVSGKPVSITKNDFTITSSTGYLCNSSTKLGINSSSAGGALVAGNEALIIALAHGADKITVSLSDITGGGTGIDFKIYMDGSTTPISYEYVTGAVSGGKLDIVLNADDFGAGVITKIEVSSVSNSAHGTESFWLDNLYAEIPGGTDTNTLRIGFEDLYNTGDADYEDVLFDLDIKPISIGDVQGGNDFLDGGAGNDVLYGEGGNDILVIGLGLDRAYGGEGADTFAITLIDSLIDRIEDFNAGQGDSINITDVLDSYDPLTDDIANFVRLVQNGADTELQINADGAGSDFVAAALIVGGTGGADIAAMITAGSLVADHSALS